MKIFIQLFFILFSAFCFGQKDKNWYAFYNSDSTKIGFKDANGTVKIEPKFETYVANTVFKNVIAVTMYSELEGIDTYFLNKAGKKFGENSVYMAGTSDFAEDSAEYEGIIKFRNPVNGNVGFFNSDGYIVIPAIYNDITNFHSGIALALKGAIWPKCDSKKQDCEHLWWSGGKVFAINAKGEELFEVPEMYSSETDYKNPIVNQKVDPEIYISYKGKDGNLYSFNNPVKDFTKWFESFFLPDFKKNKTVLPKYFYELISVSDNDDPKSKTAWKNHDKAEYIKRNQTEVDLVFNQLISGICDENIRWENYSNNLYIAEKQLPKDDLVKSTTISFDCNGTATGFQFTKIGDSFYITSAR